MIPALLVVAALVVLCTAAGLVHRITSGRVRRTARSRVDLAELGIDAAAGGRATLLQLSTTVCAPCRSTARLLSGLADRTPGLVHVEVDLAKRTDLADRFAVLQTPTTLLLDGRGVVRGRIAGAPQPQQLDRTLNALLEETHV